jgi:hypothetical protein
MKTIRIVEFRKDADELEFWIPSEFTCEMISHLRNYDIIVNIRISPIEDNKKIRDQDAFFLCPVGEKERRTKIKQSINGFCEKHGLALPKWPENF